MVKTKVNKTKRLLYRSSKNYKKKEKPETGERAEICYYAVMQYIHIAILKVTLLSVLQKQNRYYEKSPCYLKKMT